MMKNILIFLSKNRWLLFILGVGLFLRIMLNSAVDSFDFYAFIMWAKYLTTHRISDVFEFLPEGYTPYPPLYYYVLLVLGKIISFLGVWDSKWLTYLIIRSPVIIADLIAAILIHQFTLKFLGKRNALIGTCFYFLHPALIYNTSIWGQIDAIIILLGMVSLFLLTQKKYFLGLFFYMLGVLTKLQSLAMLPLIAFLTLSIPLRKWLKFAISLVFLGGLPFLLIVMEKGFRWTWDYFFTIPNWYAYTSVYTYNLWAPFGFIVSDNTKFLNLIEYKYVGIFLFWLVAFLILYPLRNASKRTPVLLMFAAFLLWYDFSFFATRIHSRYLIYSFGFFAPFFGKFPKLGILLSILMLANFLLPSKNLFLAPVILVLNQPSVIFLFVMYAFSLFIISYKVYQKLLIEYVSQE